MRRRFAYGQAAARKGVHVPSERGLTMRPGNSVPMSDNRSTKLVIKRENKPGK